MALLALSALIIAGLVTPEQALDGFSSPAVVTIWAMFILGGGLARTGVAGTLGKRVVRLAGNDGWRLLAVLVVSAGILSAFMNNIGVVALFMPVTIDIARQTGRPPSRLLLPLTYGALLGGMLTLISTPGNLLVNQFLLESGIEPFSIFDFTPVGVLILVSGALFMLLSARRLLPARGPMAAIVGANGQARSVTDLYDLEERLAILTLPADSELSGKTLAESRIGEALGLNILSLERQARMFTAPRPETVLQGEDRLLVLGRLDRLKQLAVGHPLVVVQDSAALAELVSDDIGLAELRLTTDSPYIDETISSADLRQVLQANVLAIRHNDHVQLSHLQDMPLRAGDVILLQGRRSALQEEARRNSQMRLVDELAALEYPIRHHMLLVEVPEGAPLAGESLSESRLANTYGLSALAMLRDDQRIVMPGPDTKIAAGDRLLVVGQPRDLAIVRGLSRLQVKQDQPVSLQQLQQGPMVLTEAVLAPRSSYERKTLQDLHFREKYGLNVLAIWRGGRAYRSNLADMKLRFGDALLLYGPADNVQRLGLEPDFIVLQESAQEQPRREKAPLAGLIMLGVIAVAVAGWLPIALAALVGATLMVLTGSLTIDEAYQTISWRAVFLTAAMLPLGVAMQETGTAALLAGTMISAVGGYGPLALLASVLLFTLAATQFMPNPVVAVLLAPIALTAASEAGVSPYPFLIGVAYAATSSFATPVAHPANSLVMGPGGYRFGDYARAGVPLVLVVFAVLLIALPIVWPF